jgi:hypothetical protein
MNLTRYAERFHALAGDGHHVASPLGAWLLLALCAPASTGAVRDELCEVLGVDADTAAATAAEMLGTSHPLVLAAAAAWTRPGTTVNALAGLPPEVETGDLPSQEQLDDWARRHTLGLIEQFPLEVRPETVLILATALATKVSWETPFDVVPADQLGPDSAWSRRLSRVLRTPGTPFGHTGYIVATRRAGDVAVHRASAANGLDVYSVVAAADVPAVDVLAVAYELAGDPTRQARSLFDLSLGDAPLWTVTERPVQTTAPDGREERYAAVVPAWSAKSRHKLTDADGFPAAAKALGFDQYEAAQSAVARYSRVGFEAAAVTGFASLTGMPQLRDGVARNAELRFGHPYAVVAVATSWRASAWDGVPVFSAWVADPEDAELT